MKRLTTILLVSCIALLCSNCRTTIPTRDTVRPDFNFQIQGDGLSVDMNQDFDFDNKALYLKRGATYSIIYTASDQGGLSYAALRIPRREVMILSENFDAWVNVVSNIANPQTIEWRGRRENPVTGTILTSNALRVLGPPPSGTIPNFDMLFIATDFHDNRIQKRLVVRVTNEDSRIGSID